jgi:hypothetical protein
MPIVEVDNGLGAQGATFHRQVPPLTGKMREVVQPHSKGGIGRRRGDRAAIGFAATGLLFSPDHFCCNDFKECPCIPGLIQGRIGAGAILQHWARQN